MTTNETYQSASGFGIVTNDISNMSIVWESTGSCQEWEGNILQTANKAIFEHTWYINTCQTGVAIFQRTRLSMECPIYIQICGAVKGYNSNLPIKVTLIIMPKKPMTMQTDMNKSLALLMWLIVTLLHDIQIATKVVFACWKQISKRAMIRTECFCKYLEILCEVCLTNTAIHREHWSFCRIVSSLRTKYQSNSPWNPL